MIINPKTALENGWITFPTDFTGDVEKYIQPNGIDFTLDRLWLVDSFTVAFMSEEKRIFKPTTEVNGLKMYAEGGDENEYFTLHQNNSYDFTSKFKVNLPAGVCATLLVRSSLNRVAVGLTSGLFDAGFNGNIAGHLRCFAGSVIIAKGTRVGQIVFHSAFVSNDESDLYQGIYNNREGYWLNSVGLKVDDTKDENDN